MIDYYNSYFDWNLFRRDVRCDIRNCALLLFLFYAINIGVTGIAGGIIVAAEMLGAASSAGGVPFDRDLMDIIGGDGIAILSIIGIIAGSIAFMIRRKGRFFTDVALPSAEPLRPWIFIILVVVTQGIQYVSGAATALVELALPEDISIVGNYEDVVGLLITPAGMIYVVLIGPIFEELIFRGAIMGPLRKYGDNFAILFSSLLFGLYHAVVLQIPFAFVMGLVLGYACTRWSLRTAIALHIISNGIAMFLSYDEKFALAGGVGLLFCGVATLILFFAFRRNLVTRIRAGAAYYGRATYANGFSSIAFWLFAATMIGLAALQLTGFITL